MASYSIAEATETRTGARERLRLARGTSTWLLLSVPIALLAITGSVLGLVFESEIYGRETANWAAQSIGQDIANLIAFPALLVAALFTGRGSTRAHLIWIGLLVYSAYTYAIYSFALHFGPLFLMWVAILGLSVYTLIGAVSGLDVSTISASVVRGRVHRFAARLLVAIGSLFGFLWLSEIVPSMLAGTPPQSLKEVGLLTNPVHVLDLALLLPALVGGGVLLRTHRPLGYVMAPILLVATFFLGVGIISLTLVSASRGIDAVPAVGIGMAALAVVEATTTVRLLRRVPEGATVE